jgi:hypothetical protein
VAVSFVPTRQDIAFWRGDGLVFTCTITSEGVAVDVSTYDIWCTGKRNLSEADVDAVFQVTKTAGDIVVSGAGNNIATITVPASDTVALTAPLSLFYDVQIKAPAGQPITVAWGQLTIGQDVTRAIV